jgi:D-alanyl-lipoteichoic acid acyltransferase DltB (MBOAT superfamily)
MLFNSAVFLFIFLPITLGVYLLLIRRHREVAIWWLIAASLVFYGAWDYRFVFLMLASVSVNYAIGRALDVAAEPARRRALLMIGLVVNLGALGYFKYTNFFLDTLNATGLAALGWEKVILPIGISFFTFQQIAYLVDIYRRQPAEHSFSRYLLFVAIFPHLIAGPITHHREIIPQLGQPRADRWADFASGITLLAIGLFKKVVIADFFAVPSSAIFGAAAAGEAPGLFAAWIAVLCYSLQIYFDFSAYSDMAVALGRMFGINLPINFASPYKAVSIIDFWRRWHITLSRFLRDYLYIPLGGSRKGPQRQRANLMITMLLGGIWHGAGWTFLVWGGLHGVYLLINHLWTESAAARRMSGFAFWPAASRAITLFCVLSAWVPFRAADLATTLTMWRGMFGLNGIGWPKQYVTPTTVALAILVFAATMTLPNSIEIMKNARMGTPTHGYPATYIPEGGNGLWRMNAPWAVATAVLLFVAVMKLHDISEFIYFQF